MERISGSYTDWTGIDYRPVAQVLPTRLLGFLPEPARILDMGCNKGQACIEMAQHGHVVVGMDINPDAIREAQCASNEGVGGRISFLVGDLTAARFGAEFDAVMLIRVLTCFPQEFSWSQALLAANAAIKPGGLIYINDFIADEENPIYRPRYEEGAARGLRPGNFFVNRDGDQHQSLFIAHHHSEEEIAQIGTPYEVLELRRWKGLSMNGNPCSMFELVGRKGASLRR